MGPPVGTGRRRPGRDKETERKLFLQDATIILFIYLFMVVTCNNGYASIWCHLEELGGVCAAPAVRGAGGGAGGQGAGVDGKGEAALQL